MEQFTLLILRMSPFLLLGFFFAGLLHAYVPASLYRKYLSGSDMRSVITAALFGVPLPLCSCGVIPTALSLRREGASRSSTVSFLIATPQTGVDSILATYSLLGLPFAVLRPVAAFVTAILGGAAVNRFDSRDAEGTAQASEKPSRSIVDALRYGFLEMMQDIGPWLFIGMAVAALITVLVPDGYFQILAPYPVLSMVAVLIVAVPMYLCATGSIPIAAALMLKGLSPGAALVLLMAGPAVNAASMIVVGRALGRRTLVLYMLSIIAGAMAFGLVADYLMPQEWFTLPVQNVQSAHGTGPLQIVCGAVLIVLLAVALLKRFMPHKTRSTQATYSVSGMRCNHCRESVEKTVRALPGVESAEVTLNPPEISVTGTASAEEITAAVESIGFKIERRTVPCKAKSVHSVYAVSGMRCNHCRESVEKTVRALPGVESAEVTLNPPEISVTGTASAEEITKAVESIGFKIER